MVFPILKLMVSQIRNILKKWRHKLYSKDYIISNHRRIIKQKVAISLRVATLGARIKLKMPMERQRKKKRRDRSNKCFRNRV